jgi:hypothetical protein
LVYLYLINYAKSQPDLAMLAVNTFVKDANDPVNAPRVFKIKLFFSNRIYSTFRIPSFVHFLSVPWDASVSIPSPSTCVNL